MIDLRAAAADERARASAGVVVVKLVSAGSTYLSLVLLAGLLAVEGYGRYALALSVVNLLLVPIAGGVDTLVLRELAVPSERGRPGRRVEVLRWAHRTAGVATAVVVAITVAVALVAGADRGRRDALLVGLVLLPLLSELRILGAALQGLGRPVASQIPDVLVRPVLFLVLLVVVSATAESAGTAAALALHAAAAGAGVLVGLVMLRRALTSERGRQVDDPARDTTVPAEAVPRSTWRRSAAALSAVGILYAALEWSDVLVLEWLRGPTEVGTYFAAKRLTSLTVLPELALNTVLAHALARRHAEDPAALQRMFTLATRGLVAVTAAVAIPLVLLAAPLVGLLGDDFAAAVDPLVVLTLGQLANMAFGPTAVLLLVTGHEGGTARRLAIAVAVNVALNLALIPQLGASGAALATVGSMLLWNVLLVLLTQRQVGVTAGPFGRRGVDG